PERGHVRAADALKAFGANLLVLPAFRHDRVPEPIDDFIAHVKKSGALGGEQPFMWAGRIHIAAELADVEPHHARDMRSVNRGKNSFGTSQRRELVGRQYDPGACRDMAEENHARAGSDGVVE